MAAPGPAAVEGVEALQRLHGVRRQVCGTSSCRYSRIHLTSQTRPSAHGVGRTNVPALLHTTSHWREATGDPNFLLGCWVCFSQFRKPL